MNSAALQTAAIVRALGGRVRRMPRQVPPVLIENEYTRALVPRVDRAFRAAMAPLKAELPALLASVVREARIDGFRVDAGEGRRVRELVAEAKKKMNSSLSTEDLASLADEFAKRTSSFQRIQLGRQVKAALGVDVFAADRRLVPLTEAFVDANVGLIRGLTDELANKVEKSVLSAVQGATPWSDFAGHLDEVFGFGKTRAELIARDQIGKFYGQTNAARQRELGVTHFIWRASGDERVRDLHEEISGERFSYEDGGHPTEGLPGEPILCRCSAEPDFSAILG